MLPLPTAFSAGWANGPVVTSAGRSSLLGAVDLVGATSLADAWRIAGETARVFALVLDLESRGDECAAPAADADQVVADCGEAGLPGRHQAE